MKAAAYLVATGSPITESPELLLLSNIGKYGVEAVMGRGLSHNEILCFNVAEAVALACREREQSSDWVTWGRSNPIKHKLLNEAMELVYG